MASLPVGYESAELRLRESAEPRHRGSAHAVAEPRRAPKVWAVGGGKGGVGKSVVSANLAVALASRGLRCAIVDVDLGGANQHTVLGVDRPKRSLADFFAGRVQTLSELLVPTAVPNLSLVSGARGGLDIANPRYAEKLKLLRHLRQLDVSHVIVDLGAGSSFNTLDPFIAADERVLVVAPEPTAIENAYHFLKSAFFRSLRDIAKDETARPILEACLAGARCQSLTPRELIREVALRAPELGRALAARAHEFGPALIVNQADTAAHRRVGFEMSLAARKHLGTPLRYVGGLPLDAAVPTAVTRQKPVLQLFPGAAFSQELDRTLRRLQEGKTLDERTAPPDWSVRADTPTVSTHGLAATSVKAPVLEGARPRVQQRPMEPMPMSALPPLDLERPAAYLRRCRESLGLGLAQMGERTQIRHLARLEGMVLDALPPLPYVEAQVRAYAEAMGVTQAESLAAHYIAEVKRQLEPAAPSVRQRASRALRLAVLPRRHGS
jgi:flagellar biosynthesis protein FlhG